MPDINLKLHASIALSSPQIRKVSAAYERLFSVLHLLDALPADLLEVLNDEIANEYKDRRGPLADFMTCYRAYLKDEMKEAKERDRRLRFGLGTTHSDDYLLPSRRQDEDKD
jgi:hypothetical protein